MRRAEPLVERYLAALIQGADRDCEGLATCVALVQARTMRLAFHGRCFVDGAAMRADGAIGPKASLKPFTGLCFVVKDRV